MLHLIGIIISLFLSVLLFTKKGYSRADFILANWLLFISLHLTIFYIHITGQYVQIPYFLGIEIALPLVHGPFLYLYVLSLTGSKHQKLHWSIHFSPLLLAFGLLGKFLLLSFEQKIKIYKSEGVGYENIITMIYLAILISGIIYIVSSFLLLKKHSRNILAQFSSIEKINLNWLKYLIIGIATIWLSVIFGNDKSTFAIVDLFILFLGYFGIKQVGLFNNHPIPEPIVGVWHGNLTMSLVQEEQAVLGETLDKIKYQKSSISKALLVKIHQDLVALMENEKLFKNPELSLDELSQRLEVSSNTLSQVINTIENQSFFDYINEQRIKEFMEIVMLPENRKFTLLFLAFEVGFNSKTSFNRNFKKMMGQVPTAYLKLHQIPLANAAKQNLTTIYRNKRIA